MIFTFTPKLLNILKIATAGAKVAQFTDAAVNKGRPSQFGNIAGTVAGVTSALATAGSGVDASPGGAAKPGTQAPTVKTGQMHEALKGPSGVQETLIQGGAKNITKFTPDPPGAIGQANALKLNPGGYTANQPGLQQAYLRGLEQSGAKLDKTGQIVKQSGQAYKKVGWDRNAQLKAMDPMRRQRLLAIDRANVSAAKNKRGPVTNNTGGDIMDPKNPVSPRQEQETEQFLKKESNLSKDLVIGTDKGKTSKPEYNTKLTKKEIKERVTTDNYGNVFHLDDDGVWRAKERKEALW